MSAQKQGRKRKSINTVIRVIRRIDTREYFASDGWTTKPKEALSFADSLEAAQAAIEYRLNGVEIALRLSGADADLFCMALR